jgi:protein tyrosine/serine phosphatase
LRRVATFDLSTTRGRLATYLHYLWNDHAYLRLPWSNAHWISDELVRANQPWPFQVRQWRDRGIRTIVNLRGMDSHAVLEADACARAGVKMVNYSVSSRGIPTRAQVLGAKALFEEIEYPAMMHCKSGMDRAGLMSALYLHFRKGRPIAEAVDQLHFRFGHIRAGMTGVLDYFFERYLAEFKATGISLEDWVNRDDYDPEVLIQAFKAKLWGNILTEKLLRRE